MDEVSYWIFDSGATKQITSIQKFFASLKDPTTMMMCLWWQGHHVMVGITWIYNRVASNALLTHPYGWNIVMVCCFGHLNFNHLFYLKKKEYGYWFTNIKIWVHWKACMRRLYAWNFASCLFPKDDAANISRKLQLVHTDVCSPIKTLSFGNRVNFVTFFDDATHHTWVYAMQAINEVFYYFNILLEIGWKF